jgi:hypothetical protein
VTVAADVVVTELRSHLRARHASTGRPFAPLHAVLEDPPPGWHLRVTGADVVVTARQGLADPPAPPVVRLTVGDPVLALRVQQPTAHVALTALEIVHEFDPVPMTLTVDLVAATDGKPRTGVTTLRAHGASPPAVDLPEDEPGTYRAPARVWTSDFHPLELRIGDTVLTRLAIDFNRTDTRVRVVDPT